MVSASRGRQRRGLCAGASAFLLAASCLVALAPQMEASEGANQDAVVDEREPDDSLDEGVLFTDSVQFSSADLASGGEASDTVSAGESLVGVCSVVNCFCLICGYFCSRGGAQGGVERRSTGPVGGNGSCKQIGRGERRDRGRKNAGGRSGVDA